MQVHDAQREVREVYLGGFPGELVSASIWLASAAAATWVSRSAAVVTLVVGGTFIFPLTLLLLALMKRRATLSPGNPLGAMATQVAFTIPLSYPLIWMAIRHEPTWFFPAFMVVVGAHYLPFVFLYGMRLYAVVSVLMVAQAVAVVMLGGGNFAIGGWVTGVTLLVLSLVTLALSRRAEAAPAVAVESG